MLSYRFAEREDIPKVVDLLTESFKKYDFFSFYAPEGEKGEQFHRAVQQVNAEICYTKEIVLLGIEDGKIVSVATLEAPHKKHAGLFAYLKAGGFQVLKALGIRKVLAFFNLLNRSAKPCQERYPDAWYVSSLAVDDQAKGKGYGSSLIQDAIVPNVKKLGGQQITLITNTERNCRFYERNGFTIFDTDFYQIGENTLGNWCLVRNLSE